MSGRTNKRWFAAVALVISLCACRNNVADIPAPVKKTPDPVAVTVILDQSVAGYAIPHSFQGLSYETALLAEDPDYLNKNNTVLIQLLKNLGRGLLRIGGNSSDEIEWAGDSPADSSQKKLNKADIDRLAGFAKAAGWPVLFGLNLANNNPAAAANEAAYVKARLQGGLYAFQAGNEPDFFCNTHRTQSYGYADYQREWDQYYDMVKSSVGGAAFAGPDVMPFNLRWLHSFSKNNYGKVNLLDGHYYNNGPASDPAITIADVLKPNVKMAAYLRGMSAIAAAHGLPYRISEGNSIWGQGKPGVSNTFASALWALDFMWSVAENKGQGVNFHGGGIHFVYTPINTSNGVTTVRPEYYAMLAFKYGAVDSKLIPLRFVNRNDGDNYTVHASIHSDNSTAVTIINKEVSKDFVFTIQPGTAISGVQIARLSAPAITSTEGITFAGSTVNTDGTFTPAATEQYRTEQKSFTITVPAGSAAIITLH